MAKFVVTYSENLEIKEVIVESVNKADVKKEFSQTYSGRIKEIREYTGESLLENINE